MDFELGRAYKEADLVAGGFVRAGLIRGKRFGEGEVRRYERSDTNEILLVRVEEDNRTPLEYHNLEGGEMHRYTGGGE